MDKTGSCLCGAVSFTATEVGDDVHTCHCTMCQKWSGGPGFATDASAVTLSGESHLTRYQSSDWAERGFCSKCGSNLFFYLKPADKYYMWMGAFDDVSNFKLTGEIFIDEKPAAFDFVGDHPRQTGAEFLASMEGKVD